MKMKISEGQFLRAIQEMVSVKIRITSPDFEEARSSALLRSVLLSNIFWARINEGTLRVKNIKFTFSPDYTFNLDDETDLYVFDMVINVMVGMELLGHIRECGFKDHMFRILLNNGMVLLIPCDEPTDEEWDIIGAGIKQSLAEM